jgi:hypothetical protein
MTIAMRMSWLLKERHAESTLKNRNEERVRIDDLLFTSSPQHVWVGHLADNRSGPNDGYLHDKVIEDFGKVPHQSRHLGRTLHLEKSNSIGQLKQPIDGLILRELTIVQRNALMPGNQFEAV